MHLGAMEKQEAQNYVFKSVFNPKKFVTRAD